MHTRDRQATRRRRCFEKADPIFLISGLAEHTKNLERDPRASLLVAEGGSADPLANGRVTMLGPSTPVGEDGGRARATFFAAHPNSIYYADFRDFTFWKLHVDYVRYIGGYGRMSWISQADWRAAEPGPLAPSAADMIAHMNADHADALVLSCKAFSHGTEITSAKMTGVDRYGFEMSAMTSNGPCPLRLAFAKPVSTPEEVRATLISMVKDVRSKLLRKHCKRRASRSRLKVLKLQEHEPPSHEDTRMTRRSLANGVAFTDAKNAHPEANSSKVGLPKGDRTATWTKTLDPPKLPVGFERVVHSEVNPD